VGIHEFGEGEAGHVAGRGLEAAISLHDVPPVIQPRRAVGHDVHLFPRALAHVRDVEKAVLGIVREAPWIS
jgi:hypothetical protein